jgi:glycosyltransferase involved in cell wall biosynthesis
MPPLLTIGIPTYNRVNRLPRLLDSIVAQLPAEMRPIVEVLVSDNASTDGTPELVARYVKAHGIVSRRNPENLGYDGNVAAIAATAQGEFLWMMGDDDWLAPGSLERLAGLLRADAADVIILPARREDFTDAHNTAAFFGIDRPLAAPLDELLNRFGLFGVLNALGHPVFRRRLLKGLDVYPAMGTRFCHTFLVASSFARHRAMFRPESYFIVPNMTAGEAAAREERWHVENIDIDGWYNCYRAVLHMIDHDGVPPPRQKSFFRMVCYQTWPLHYHVYKSVQLKLFARHETIAPEEWERLRRFDRLLSELAYTAMLDALGQAAGALTTIHEATRRLVAAPQPVYDLAKLRYDPSAWPAG